MRHYFQRFGVLLILPLLFLTCEKDSVQLDDLSEDLDLRGLDIQFRLDYNYDFGYDSPVELTELVNMLASEMYEEDGNDINWVKIAISPNSTSLLFDDGKETSFEKKGGCSDEGWDRLGARCHSEQCVRDRVEIAFETKPEQGQCLDVRIDRGGLGVRVCTQLSECG
jgi:hypothetical protein